MRRIPVLEEHIKQDVGCAHLLDSDDVKVFESHSQDEYKKMFKEQGNNFWIKYVIKLRDAIYEKFECNISANEFDYLFIDLLKKLISKNKQSAVDFISNVCMMLGSGDYLPDYELFAAEQNVNDKETVRKIAKSFFNTSLELVQSSVRNTLMHHYKYIFIIITHCAFVLIKFMRIWKICEEGEDLKWSPPKRWRSDACTGANPFEAFLRSRWGGELLKILNLKKEYIGWWRAPAKSPAKECWCSPMHFRSDNDHTNTNGWLPSIHDRPEFLDANHTEYDFFERLEASGTDIQKWNVYEVAMGPILSPNYHDIDIMNIMPEVEDKQHMGVGPWYIGWNIAFGYELYTSYLQHHYELKDILEKSNEKKKKQWVEEMEQTHCIISKTTEMEFSPRAIFDSVYDTREFLLEPCVLIKLPWQPVLLQQWLSIALVEILQFEVESLELRHWPLPQNIERCVCELLTFIADAKQRVLLGLCFHVQQCIAFPKLSDKFPQLLMQHAIQPSLPAIKFLVEKEGLRILGDLKIMAFSEERSNSTKMFKESVYIPGEAYKIDNHMIRFYTNHFWHISYWLHETLEEPLPWQFSPDNFDIESYVTENSMAAHGIPVPLPRNIGDHASQLFSEEEEKFRDYFLKLDLKVEPKDTIKKMVKMVKLYVFKSGLYPESDWITLKQSLEDTEVSHLTSMPLVSQLAMYAVLHDNMCAVLNGIDSRHSPLTTLVRLSGELIEHEQKVRVGYISAQMLQKCPVLHIEVEEYRSIDEVSKIIQEAIAKKSEFTLPTRSLLWLPFPKNWREEMNITEECPKLSDGIDQCIHKFENRLRRMLVKEHKEIYDMWEQGCEIFPLSLECQFLLPQYVSVLVTLKYEPKTKKIEKKIQRYIYFVHNVIRFYEEKLMEWLNNTDKKRSSSCQVYVVDKAKKVGKSMVLKMHLIPSIRQIMNAFVGLGIGFEGAPGFSEIFQSMIEWPIIKNSEYVVEGMTIKAWEYMSYHHSLRLYNLCYDMWQLPQPTSDFGDSLLEKTYFACTVIQKLNVIIGAQVSHFPLIMLLTEFEKFSNNDVDESIDHIRIDVVSKIAQKANLIEKEKSISEESLKEQLEEYLITLHSIFRLMSTIRVRLGDAKLISPDFPASDSLSVKNATALFFANKLSALSKILDLPTDKVTLSKAKKSKKKNESNGSIEVSEVVEISQEQQHKKCRKCGKTESKKVTFIACTSCLAVSYPDVNYYCSIKCKDEWWAEEHMAEHLEFDLGLSDFDIKPTPSSSQ